MNLEKLFNLFKSSSDDELEEREKELEDQIKDDPFLRIGLVIEGVQNHSMLLTILRYRYGDKVTQEQEENIRNIHYNRLYSLLEDFSKEVTSQDLEKINSYFHPDKIKRGLGALLHFFEKKEDYLKCAEVLKIQNLLLEPIQEKQ